MEKLVGTEITRGGTECDAEVMLKFKEFLLVFYGAHWSSASRQVAGKINELMKAVNPEGDDREGNIEVFYMSNDTDSEENNRFLME